MHRPDETWHRLLQWTYGQTPSERLAAQILYASGFEDIDPIHPLGGRDGGKDALCKKNEETWVMAVYFPHGQKLFKQITDKFKSDLDGAKKNNASGIAFVTNQAISDGERKKLISKGNKFSPKISVEIFHIERIQAVLDKPTMATIREQYLYITANKSISIVSDQQLFADFLMALPSNGDVLNLLKEHDFGSSFPSNQIDVLDSFNQSWRDAVHEFLDDNLNLQLKVFLMALNVFLEEISIHAFSGNVQGRMTIGMQDWEDKPEMYALKEKLNKLATTVYAEHQTLVRSGRKRLAQ